MVEKKNLLPETAIYLSNINTDCSSQLE